MGATTWRGIVGDGEHDDVATITVLASRCDLPEDYNVVMSGVRGRVRIAAALFAAAGAVSGCGSGGGDSAATTSAAPDSTAAAATTTEAAAETTVGTTAVATTEAPSTTGAPSTTAPWTPPFEHGCDETGPTRTAPPTYDEAALDRFGPIGVEPAVEIALPYDLTGRPARTGALRVPGGMLLTVRSDQYGGTMPGSMVLVVDHDGVVRWTRCYPGYVQTFAAPASDRPDAIVLTTSSGALPSDASTSFVSLADGSDVGSLDGLVAESALPTLERGWMIETAGGSVAAVTPMADPTAPAPDTDVVGLLDLVDMTLDVIAAPEDGSVMVTADGTVEAWPSEPGNGDRQVYVDGRWVDAPGGSGTGHVAAGFDYRAYPEATVLAGFEPDGSVRWRRDDITIPVGEGVFSAVSDDVVIAVFCGTPVTTADLGCDDFRSGGFSVENGATLWLDLGGFPTAFGDGAALVTGAAHGHDWVMIDVHTGALIREDQVWDGEPTLFGEECCGGDEFLRVDQYGGVLYTVADQLVRVWLPADVAAPTTFVDLTGRA